MTEEIMRTAPGVLQKAKNDLEVQEQIWRDRLNRSNSEKTKRNLQLLLNFKEQQLDSTFDSEIVPGLYEDQSILWMRRLWDTSSSQDTFSAISNGINDFLQGKYSPLFIPIRAAEPNDELTRYLDANEGEKVLGFLENTSFNEIVSRLSGQTNAAFIHIVVNSTITYAILTQLNKPVEVLKISSFPSKNLEHLIHGWLWLYYGQSESVYGEAFKSRFSKANLSAERLRTLNKDFWVRPYEKLRLCRPLLEKLAPAEVPYIDEQPVLSFPSWVLMEVLLYELGIGYQETGKGLWGILHQQLSERGIEHLTLCLDKTLSLLPHHAAVIERTKDGKKITLIDKYKVSYLPQGMITSAPHLAPVNRILVAGTQGDDEILSNVAVSAISQLASQDINITAASLSHNPDALSHSLLNNGADALTFVGHSQYDWKNPEKSILGILKDSVGWKKVIRLDDFIEATSARLNMVILAACSSGLSGTQTQTSEYRGFAVDLLSKGHVPIIISTLWPVYALSTIVLMIKLHENLMGLPHAYDKGPDVAMALQMAQIWLRDASQAHIVQMLKALLDLANLDEIERTNIKKGIEEIQSQYVTYPFAHPYFWATFYVMSGVN